MSRTQMARCAGGFTLIELLVVIAVVGVLVSLLLPAIQAAREAARRVQCANHLKQMGLAMHQYHDTHQRFPINGGSSRFSPQARILPFLEQSGLHDQIDYSQPLFLGSGPNQVVNPLFANIIKAKIPPFLCPSDPGPEFYTVTMGTPPVAYQFGPLNYAISNGSGEGTNYDDRYRTNGIAWQNGAARVADITDGTAYSVMTSEMIRGDGLDTTLPAGVRDKRPYQKILNMTSGVSSNPSPTPGYTASGGVWPSGPILNPELAIISLAGTNWRGGASGTGRGTTWIRGLTQAVMTNGYLSPNSETPDVFMHGTGYFGPRSFHGNGANVGMADGAVKYLSAGVSLPVSRALHSTRGGEAISAGTY